MPDTLAHKLSGIDENQLHRQLADDLRTMTTVLRPLQPETRETCDRCGPGTLALFGISLPTRPADENSLTFCGHHSRWFGYDPATHKTYLTQENRQQGSDS